MGIPRKQINGKWYSVIQCEDSIELAGEAENMRNYEKFGVSVFVDFTTNTLYFDHPDRNWRARMLAARKAKRMEWNRIGNMTYAELAAEDNENYTVRHGLEYDV